MAATPRHHVKVVVWTTKHMSKKSLVDLFADTDGSVRRVAMLENTVVARGDDPSEDSEWGEEADLILDRDNEDVVEEDIDDDEDEEDDEDADEFDADFDDDDEDDDDISFDDDD